MSTIVAQSDSGEIRILEGPVTDEPDPVWADAPGYASGIALPAYRYVPGLNPHPQRDKKGHMFGKREMEFVPITGDNWRASTRYLYGIDLYHNGYLWEAHEAWEGLWKAADDDSLEANFLQALILNAAAQLKAHTRRANGVRTHSQAARWRLARIRSRGYDGPQMPFLGIDVGDLVAQLKRHYGPVCESKDMDVVRLKGEAPRLELKLD